MDNKLSNVDDIVAMLDGMVEKGTGHINVTLDPDQTDAVKNQTMASLDCAKGNLACHVPTLMEGVDDLGTFDQK